MVLLEWMLVSESCKNNDFRRLYQFTTPGTMENDPLKQLTEFFKGEGYNGKEAVEEAKIELANRRRERELELTLSTGKNHPSDFLRYSSL